MASLMPREGIFDGYVPCRNDGGYSAGSAMKFLVDANVISEATKPCPAPPVVAWLRRNEAELAIDPVVLGEIRLGIMLLPKSKRRAALEAWFDQGVRTIVCLSWDATTAFHWAGLLARLRAKGAAMPLKDSMIAACALTHELAVATRNVADFKLAGIRVVNPFE
jgi:toxin FitB